MNHLVTQFVGKIRFRLPKFVRKSGNLFNFRCVFCNDSARNSRKARGYIYERKAGAARYHCHNCGLDITFEAFLKRFDPALYNEYLFAKLADKQQLQQVLADAKPTDPSNVDLIVQECPALSMLPSDHSAVRYIVNRKLDRKWLDSLRYTEQFEALTNQIIKDKFDLKKIKRSEPRIIIPLADKKGLFGYQGRAIGDNATLRYISIIVDTTRPKLYGLDRIDYSKTIYCVEGPFDAMFVDNGIASCGGKIQSELAQLSIDKDRYVIVYDNQPRNREMCAQQWAAIVQGYATVVWPSHIEAKDINSMVLDGVVQANQVNSLLEASTYRGLQAQLQFRNWSQCNVD